MVFIRLRTKNRALDEGRPPTAHEVHIVRYFRDFEVLTWDWSPTVYRHVNRRWFQIIEHDHHALKALANSDTVVSLNFESAPSSAGDITWSFRSLGPGIAFETFAIYWAIYRVWRVRWESLGYYNIRMGKGFPGVISSDYLKFSALTHRKPCGLPL